MDTRFQLLDYSGNLSSFGSSENQKLGSRVHHLMDTILQLDSSTSGNKRKRSVVDGTESPEDDFSLVLGLGRSSSSSESSKISSTTAYTTSSAKETDEETSMDLELNFQLHLGSDGTSSHRKSAVDAEKRSETAPLFDLQLSLSTGLPTSAITSAHHVLNHPQSSLEASVSVNALLPVDDGSTSSRWKSGGLLLPHIHSVQTIDDFTPSKNAATTGTSRAQLAISSTAMPAQKSSVTSTSGARLTHDRRNSSTKTCLFQGCEKGGRGASGLCIAHGGGRRCQREGCQKGAEGRTVYCKAHGGGRRCEFLGCTKSAEGRTDYCIGHGGGRRCGSEGCTKASRGKTGFCIKHGGGKRCQKDNCTNSAEGYTGLCIAHGGGRRCRYPFCTKGAQGSTRLCKAHGGGKRCISPGCNKGAEGSTSLCKGHGGGKRCTFQGDVACPRSVHGGTLFCVRHGGGKRCGVLECTNSARGSTAFCVSHGGGRRCKSEGCDKSAQGSTDFCKGHGGGKRCSWERMVSVLGIRGAPCDRYPRGRNGLCAAHSAIVQNHKVHGGGTLGPDVMQETQLPAPMKMKELLTEDTFPELGHRGKSFVGWNFMDSRFRHEVSPQQSSMVTLPEGRVHGGSLMARLANRSSALSNSEHHAGGCSTGANPMPHTWV